MKIQTTKLIFLTVVYVLSACNNSSTTKLTSTSEPTIISTAGSQVFLDPAYYDGIIVITQYYTYLGNGLHEKAYLLLSVSEQKNSNSDEYVKNTRIAFKTVEIVSIQPYFAVVGQQGGQTTPDPSNRKRFVAKIRAWGQGNMSGSVTNGSLQTLYLALVHEDGQWRIDSFSTAPLP